MLELFSDLISLAVIITGLLLTLFQYIEIRQRKVMIAVLFYLAMLLSQYFWTASIIVTGDYPGISSFFSYAGWNIAYAVLLILVWRFQEKRVREHISPFVFLLIPATAYQFYLYIPFGGVINSAYQCLMATLVAMVCLQSILWYFWNKEKGAEIPHVHIVVFIYSIFEFGMWTSSCYDFWTENQELYHLFGYLSYIALLLLPLALRKILPYKRLKTTDAEQNQRVRFLKMFYSFGTSLCCLAGVLVGVWMRGKIGSDISDVTAGNLYDLISVMLFVFSLAIVAFTVVMLVALDFRHRAVENETLRREKELAERLNSAKSEFLANMSHEIRTPINAILGMNEMVLRESDSENVARYARNLENAGKNLLAIINDILDFSKIESGKIDIKQVPYQLSSVLNDVCNMIKFRAQSKELSFQADIDNTLPDGLVGDEVRVRQIITNLLNNAVKYTDEGGVTLTVGRRPSEKNELELIISVTDTGIGIREKDIGKLFTKFERVDMERNSTVEGTGLGLAITERLIDLMGGEISVKSVYGKGSTFTAIIPQGVCDAASIGNFRKRFEENTGETKTYCETFRAPDALILAVDDMQMNLIVIEDLLKQTQIQIDTAESGSEALIKTKSTHYDLILMDQRMPEMDGVATLSHIRVQENGCNRETPVICLTADAVQGARERYLAEGFTDYVSKPVNVLSLEETLMKHLPPEKVVRMAEEAPVTGEISSESEGVIREIYDSTDMLNFDAGMQYAITAEKLRKNISRFYEMLVKNTTVLEELYARNDYENYEIKVHALKSGARMIGATTLSGMAAELEESSGKITGSVHDEALREEALRFTQEKTPELFAAMRALAESLEPYMMEMTEER